MRLYWMRLIGNDAMKVFALAVLAVLFFGSAALATSYVDGVITSVDVNKQTITLNDKTIMELPALFDATTIPVGEKVRIFAEIDEDGFEPITKIDLAK
jgi:hypothetical protein